MKTDITSDNAGLPVILFYEFLNAGPNARLQYAKFVGNNGNCNASTAWSCEYVDTAGGDEPTILRKNNGQLVAGYWSEDSLTIKYAEYVGGWSGNCLSGGNWNCENVATRVSIGGDSVLSVVLTSDDTPAFSFADILTGELQQENRGPLYYVSSSVILPSSTGRRRLVPAAIPPPLPVEEIDFQTSYDPLAIVLSWKIPLSSELNRIEMYRNWNPNSEINFLGPFSILAPQSRTFRDERVETGKTYHYMIRDVDFLEQYAASEEIIVDLMPEVAAEERMEDTPTEHTLKDEENTEAPMIFPLQIGHLYKTETTSSVYYIAMDNTRFAFPNEKVFLSWYPNFDEVLSAPQKLLEIYPLTGNVTLKPGRNALLKVASMPQVYMVTRGGVLRWITSAQVAEHIVGGNWQNGIYEVNAAFLSHYRRGKNIDSMGDYSSSEDEVAKCIDEDRGISERCSE
jgi:hypothetical protein